MVSLAAKPDTSMTAAALFVSTFCIVFALGAQSLLVNNGRYVGAFFNSFIIGACHLTLYKLTPQADTTDMIAFLSGGPLGIFAAMYLFRHLHRKRDD